MLLAQKSDVNFWVQIEPVAWWGTPDILSRMQFDYAISTEPLNLADGSTVNNVSMLTINELWQSTDSTAWDHSLERYWQFVKPANLNLERELENLDLQMLRELDSQGWYSFLRDKYFRWKYTAPNRYGSTTKSLKEYLTKPNTLGDLDEIKHKLLQLDPSETKEGLRLACMIKGLGSAGASGLLALMYPTAFATVDQFVVKALCGVHGLQKSAEIAKMNPESLNVQNAVVLISIMIRKAAENNNLFGVHTWTARKIDQILWTYGR